MILAPSQGHEVTLTECSIVVLDGGLRELSLGCRAKERQIQRGVRYGVSLAFEGQGRVDLGTTVERALHAQEVLSFAVSPKAIILPATGPGSSAPTLTLTLLNRSLYSQTSAAWKNQAEAFAASFKQCVLDGEPSALVPLHQPGSEWLAYECEVPERWMRTRVPARQMPLAVVDALGHTLFETTVLVASLPALGAVEPQTVEYHFGSAGRALRLQLLTPDSAFFAAFETQAVLLNRTFPIRTAGPSVYFDLEVEGEPFASQKLDSVELVIQALGEGLALSAPQRLGQVAPLTVYLLAAPELLTLSHHVLFTRGGEGEEVDVRAGHLPPGVHVEMILSKVRLLPGEAPRPGTEISV